MTVCNRVIDARMPDDMVIEGRTSYLSLSLAQRAEFGWWLTRMLNFDSIEHIVSVEYDLVDVPLLRVVRRKLNEDGTYQWNPASGLLVNHTTEHPITEPLPDWWTP